MSQYGSDAWSGKRSEPNSQKTDGPFATLGKARDAIRKIKKKGEVPNKGIVVYIRSGIYAITETFKLTKEDSGTENAPITWRSYPGENVHFFGGKTIANFEPVTDPDILKRFNQSCRDKILKSDLKKHGILKYGRISSRGWNKGRLGMELFFKGKRMPISRYPNKGWMKIANVPQSSLRGKYFGKGPGHHCGIITYNDDRPRRWAELDDIWMHGYWTWDWADEYQKIEHINTRTRAIYPAEPYHRYGFKKGQRYYYLNILEEIDSPGEWYIDRENGVLYFLPPSQINENDTYVSFLDEPMMVLENTSYMTIQGISFEGVQCKAVQINGGTKNKFAGCTMKNVGTTAVEIKGGDHNGITGCDLYGIGSSAITISGGDRKNLTPAGNYVTNNHIYDYSIVNRTIKVAVNMRGVGNYIANNKIHDAPHMAIIFGGNENIIEFNEIYRLLLETNDAGAVYMGRNPSEQGNIIRYNYFHHIGKEKGHGTSSVYFDDGQCGNTVFGNIFYKGGKPGNSRMGAVHIHGGRYNTIENNIFIKCKQAYNERPWKQKRWGEYFDAKLWQKRLYKEVDISKPPFTDRYPWLVNLKSDQRPNVLEKNIVYKCNRFRKNGKQVLTNNLETSKAPGFVDENSENFILRDDSWVYEKIPGFKKIPFDKIGLYVDEYRTSLSK